MSIFEPAGTGATVSAVAAMSGYLTQPGAVFCYGLNIMWMGYIVKGLWRAIVRKEILHEHDKST